MKRKNKQRTFIYFIRAIGGKQHPIKIGITNDIKKRLAQLQTGSPYKYVVLGLLRFHTRSAAFSKEAQLHQQFAQHRLEGEWFAPAPALLNYMRALGIPTHATKATNMTKVYKRRAYEDNRIVRSTVALALKLLLDE